MDKSLGLNFGLNFEEIEEIIGIVTRNLIEAIKAESTINGIKYAALLGAMSDIKDSNPLKDAFIGMMVEQAYNAAVLASRNKLKFAK